LATVKKGKKEMKMIARVLCAAAVAFAIAGCDQGKKDAPAPDAKAAVKEAAKGAKAATADAKAAVKDAKDAAKEVKAPAAPAAPAKK